MRLSGFVVSVDYSDYLEKSISSWIEGLDSLTVVTSLTDQRTAEIAIAHDARIFMTDAFTRNGAVLNKGLALSESYAATKPDDWACFFDADVTIEKGWRQKVEGLLRPGYLHGAPRFDESGKRVRDDSICYGWTQIFSVQDPLAQTSPLFETCWSHAGVYDGKFMLKWKTNGLLRELPIRLTHAGIGPSENWYGRGKHEEFRKMQAERARRGGGWKSIEGERITAR